MKRILMAIGAILTGFALQAQVSLGISSFDKNDDTITAVHLDISGLEGEGRLYAASGVEDGGTSDSRAWTQRELIATLPAGTTSYTCAMPRTWEKTAVRLRFFLVAGQDLPEGYTVLDALGSTGEATLDLGFPGTKTMVTRMRFHYQTPFGYWLYGNCPDDVNDYRFFNTGNHWYLDLPGNQRIDGEGAPSSETDEVELGNGYIRFGEWVMGEEPTNGSLYRFDFPPTAVNMTLFSAQKAGENWVDYGTIYFLRVYERTAEGLKLVHDFVPSRNPEGTVGLYDAVAGGFRTTAGLLAGTEVLGGIDTAVSELIVSDVNLEDVEKDPAVISAPGAGVTVENIGPYTIYTFDADAALTVTQAGFADVLLVGGGGAGGTTMAAGGGAGGFVQAKDVYLPRGMHSVTVGAGGAAGPENIEAAQNIPGGTGGDSSLSCFATVALGGGGGGSWVAVDGTSGGSGGGSRTGVVGQGTPGQGHNGGAAYYNSVGGGGGAGKAGGNGSADGSYAGFGGAGLPSDYSGTIRYYAGGGGGGAGGEEWIGGSPWKSDWGGPGGLGGGGKGADRNSGLRGENGTDGLGGGGGGGGFAPATQGGAGGRGVVIVRVRNADYAAAEPMLTVYGAISTTQSSAKILWSVLDAGALSDGLTVKVNYGTAPEALTTQVTLAEGKAAQGLVTSRFAGLSPATTYYAQLVYVNASAADVAVGEVFSFTTTAAIEPGSVTEFYWNPEVTDGRWDDFASWVDAAGEDLDPSVGTPNGANVNVHFSNCTKPTVVRMSGEVTVQTVRSIQPVDVTFRSADSDVLPTINCGNWDNAFMFTGEGTHLVFDGVKCVTTGQHRPPLNGKVSFVNGAQFFVQREILQENDSELYVGSGALLSFGEYIKWYDNGFRCQANSNRLVLDDGTFDGTAYSYQMSSTDAHPTASVVEFRGTSPSFKVPNLWTRFAVEGSTAKLLFHVEGAYTATPVTRNPGGAPRETWADVDREWPTRRIGDYPFLYESALPLDVAVAEDSPVLTENAVFCSHLLEWEPGIEKDLIRLVTPNDRKCQIFFTYGWEDGHSTWRTEPENETEKPTGIAIKNGPRGLMVIIR